MDKPKDYQIVIDVKYEPDENGVIRRYMYCPFNCGAKHQAWLITASGQTGCNDCMGGRFQHRVERFIRQNGKLAIDGVVRFVDMGIARLLGWR